MLSKHFDKEKINTEHQDQFRKAWFNYVHEQRSNLLENNIFNYDVVEERSMLVELDYDYWLTILNEIESDIYFLNNTPRRHENIKKLFKNSNLLYNSPLAITSLLVSFSYYITNVLLNDEVVAEMKILFNFFESQLEYLNRYENEYYLLLKGIQLSYIDKDDENITILYELMTNSSDSYIVSYSSYSLQNAYKRRNRFIEMILTYRQGKEQLEFQGCHRRIIYFDMGYALAHMFLGKDQECIQIQKKLVNYCKELGMEEVYNFQLKQLFWSYFRIGDFSEMMIIANDLDTNSTLLKDKSFLLHLTLFYIEINDQEKVIETIEKSKQCATNHYVQEYIEKYINSLITQEHIEQTLLKVVEVAKEYNMVEVILHYTPKLIHLLKQKRKYKECMYYQNLILSYTIESST